MWGNLLARCLAELSEDCFLLTQQKLIKLLAPLINIFIWPTSQPSCNLKWEAAVLKPHKIMTKLQTKSHPQLQSATVSDDTGDPDPDIYAKILLIWQ